MFDILVKGGILYDGAGGEGQKVDIAVAGDTIEAIGHFDADRAEHVIDATGMAVAPGFIDCHSHSDLSIIADPLADSKLRQGVTTEIVGNCGTSAAPFHEEILSGFMADFRDELLKKPSWHTFRDYFDLIENQGTVTNIASHVGHGNIRLLAIGSDEGAATRKGLRGMRALVKQCMKEGAIGFCTGLIYPPGMYADTAELVECARALKRADGIYASHIRSEGDGVLEAVGEAIEIGRRAEVPVQISHLKVSGQPNWPKLDRVFEEIERARDEGIQVTCDRYPYTAGATWLAAVLPDWAQAGGRESILKRLASATERERIESELRKTYGTNDRWRRIMVVSVKDRVGDDIEGLMVAEVAELRRAEPTSVVIDLLAETDLGAGAITFSMSEENMRRVLKKPYVMIGSDAWSVRAKPGQRYTHPRAYGTFPRVLGRLVRDGTLSLPAAIHKMTGMPAERFHLSKRGLLRDGWFADIVVFDPESILDLATYQEPHQYPVGIEYVIVNGTIAVDAGAATGECAGRVLRGAE